MNQQDRDQLLLGMRIDIAEIKTRIEALPDHETRLRRIETWMYGIPVAVVTAVIVPFAAHFL